MTPGVWRFYPLDVRNSRGHICPWISTLGLPKPLHWRLHGTPRTAMTFVLWFCQPCHLDPRRNIVALDQAMLTSLTRCTKNVSISSLNRLQSRDSVPSLSGADAASIVCRRRWVGSTQNSTLDAWPTFHLCRTMTFGAVSQIQVCQAAMPTASRPQSPFIDARTRSDSIGSLRPARVRWIGMIRISISRNTQTPVSLVTRPKRVPSWGAGFGMRLYRPRQRYSEMLWSIVRRTDGMGRWHLVEGAPHTA